MKNNKILFQSVGSVLSQLTILLKERKKYVARLSLYIKNNGENSDKVVIENNYIRVLIRNLDQELHLILYSINTLPKREEFNKEILELEELFDEEVILNLKNLYNSLINNKPIISESYQYTITKLRQTLYSNDFNFNTYPDIVKNSIRELGSKDSFLDLKKEINKFYEFQIKYLIARKKEIASSAFKIPIITGIFCALVPFALFFYHNPEMINNLDKVEIGPLTQTNLAIFLSISGLSFLGKIKFKRQFNELIKNLQF